MKQILRRQYIYAILSVAVMIISAVGLWRVGAIMYERTSLVVSAKEQLATYEANKQTFANESNDLQAIAGRTFALEAHRITPETIPDVLSSFEALAKEHNVTFSITGVNAPGENSASQLLIGISALGTDADVDAFLKALFSQPYQIRLTTFSYAAEPGVVTTDASGAAITLPSSKWDLLATIQIISF